MFQKFRQINCLVQVYGTKLYFQLISPKISYISTLCKYNLAANSEYYKVLQWIIHLYLYILRSLIQDLAFLAVIGKHSLKRATASSAFFTMVAEKRRFWLVCFWWRHQIQITPPSRSSGGHCEIGPALVLKEISTIWKYGKERLLKSVL